MPRKKQIPIALRRQALAILEVEALTAEQLAIRMDQPAEVGKDLLHALRDHIFVESYVPKARAGYKMGVDRPKLK